MARKRNRAREMIGRLCTLEIEVGQSGNHTTATQACWPQTRSGSRFLECDLNKGSEEPVCPALCALMSTLCNSVQCDQTARNEAGR
jgi:hypothetical protein